MTDSFTEQAIEITRAMKAIRDAQPKREPRLITGAELQDMTIMPRGWPSADDPPAEVFREGLRWWALAVAPQLTGKGWDALILAAAEAVPDFPGSVISMFEDLFDGMRLGDGTLVMK